MEKKSIYILLSILLFGVVLAAIFIYAYSSSPQSSPRDLEECKTLAYSGKDGVNLVFFSTEEDAEKYSDFLFTISPFKDQKDNFNVFYIPDYKPSCEFYKNVAILCYSRELVRKASSCPNDYIIVLDNQPSNVRSSAYMNVLSINTEHPLTVFPHEFGHAFANLAEEYTPAKVPRRSQNCVSTCETFGDSKDGCFEGCSRNDYFRSVDEGIMRTLSSDRYGIFDEALILARISAHQQALTGQVIDAPVSCDEEEYYLIEAQYSPASNAVKILDKSLVSGCIGSNGLGDFQYALLDAFGNKISTNSFNAELIFTDGIPEHPAEPIVGETFESDRPFVLKVPAIPSADKIEFTYNVQETQITLNDIGARPCRI